MKKVKISLMIITCILLVVNSFAQEKSKNVGVKWLSFEDAVIQNSKTPKKIYLDMYTNWCGWCKRMDATTFSDPVVADYLNKNFYPVKFNAETKDSIFFKDQYFHFKPEYKSNELAAILLNGKMSYPTSVFLDGESNVIGPLPGYLTAEQFIPVLRYFAEDFYKSISWDDYMKEQAK